MLMLAAALIDMFWLQMATLPEMVEFTLELRVVASRWISVSSDGAARSMLSMGLGNKVLFL
jgi:hypothetical protein